MVPDGSLLAHNTKARKNSNEMSLEVRKGKDWRVHTQGGKKEGGKRMSVQILNRRALSRRGQPDVSQKVVS